MLPCEAGRALAALVQADPASRQAEHMVPCVAEQVGAYILPAALHSVAALAPCILAPLALAALAPRCEEVVVPSSLLLAHQAASAVYAQEAV